MATGCNEYVVVVQKSGAPSNGTKAVTVAFNPAVKRNPDGSAFQTTTTVNYANPLFAADPGTAFKVGVKPTGEVCPQNVYMPVQVKPTAAWCQVANSPAACRPPGMAQQPPGQGKPPLSQTAAQAAKPAQPAAAATATATATACHGPWRAVKTAEKVVTGTGTKQVWLSFSPPAAYGAPGVAGPFTVNYTQPLYTAPLNTVYSVKATGKTGPGAPTSAWQLCPVGQFAPTIISSPAPGQNKPTQPPSNAVVPGQSKPAQPAAAATTTATACHGPWRAVKTAEKVVTGTGTKQVWLSFSPPAAYGAPGVAGPFTVNYTQPLYTAPLNTVYSVKATGKTGPGAPTSAWQLCPVGQFTPTVISSPAPAQSAATVAQAARVGGSGPPKPSTGPSVAVCNTTDRWRAVVKAISGPTNGIKTLTLAVGGVNGDVLLPVNYQSNMWNARPGSIWDVRKDATGRLCAMTAWNPKELPYSDCGGSKAGPCAFASPPPAVLPKPSVLPKPAVVSTQPQPVASSSFPSVTPAPVDEAASTDDMPVGETGYAEVDTGAGEAGYVDETGEAGETGYAGDEAGETGYAGDEAGDAGYAGEAGYGGEVGGEAGDGAYAYSYGGNVSVDAQLNNRNMVVYEPSEDGQWEPGVSRPGPLVNVVEGTPYGSWWRGPGVPVIGRTGDPNGVAMPMALPRKWDGYRPRRVAGPPTAQPKVCDPWFGKVMRVVDWKAKNLRMVHFALNPKGKGRVDVVYPATAKHAVYKAQPGQMWKVWLSGAKHLCHAPQPVQVPGACAGPEASRPSACAFRPIVSTTPGACKQVGAVCSSVVDAPSKEHPQLRLVGFRLAPGVTKYIYATPRQEWWQAKVGDAWRVGVDTEGKLCPTYRHQLACDPWFGMVLEVSKPDDVTKARTIKFAFNPNGKGRKDLTYVASPQHKVYRALPGQVWKVWLYGADRVCPTPEPREVPDACAPSNPNRPPACLYSPNPPVDPTGGPKPPPPPACTPSPTPEPTGGPACGDEGACLPWYAMVLSVKEQDNKIRQIELAFNPGGTKRMDRLYAARPPLGADEETKKTDMYYAKPGQVWRVYLRGADFGVCYQPKPEKYREKCASPNDVPVCPYAPDIGPTGVCEPRWGLVTKVGPVQSNGTRTISLVFHLEGKRVPREMVVRPGTGTGNTDIFNAAPGQVWEVHLDAGSRAVCQDKPPKLFRIKCASLDELPACKYNDEVQKGTPDPDKGGCKVHPGLVTSVDPDKYNENMKHVWMAFNVDGERYERFYRARRDGDTADMFDKAKRGQVWEVPLDPANHYNICFDTPPVLKAQNCTSTTDYAPCLYAQVPAAAAQSKSSNASTEGGPLVTAWSRTTLPPNNSDWMNCFMNKDQLMCRKGGGSVSGEKTAMSSSEMQSLFFPHHRDRRDG